MVDIDPSNIVTVSLKETIPFGGNITSEFYLFLESQLVSFKRSFFKESVHKKK